MPGAHAVNIERGLLVSIVAILKNLTIAVVLTIAVKYDVQGLLTGRRRFPASGLGFAAPFSQNLKIDLTSTSPLTATFALRCLDSVDATLYGTFLLRQGLTQNLEFVLGE